MQKLLQYAHKAIICVILFLLGAKMLDKQMRLSVGLISYGEILFLAYFFFALLKVLKEGTFSWFFVSPGHKRFTLYLACFALWTGLSWSVNVIFRDGDIADLFGMTARVLFYCLMSVFVAVWCKEYGPKLVAFSFCCGVLATFFYNFSVAALAMAVIGVPGALPENNFSGVLLPVSAMYLALTGMVSPGIVTLLLMCVCYASTLLVYSLGGYISMIFGFPAVLLALLHFFLSPKVGKQKKTVALMIFSVAAIVVVIKAGFAYDTISHHVQSKFANLSFLEKEKRNRPVQSGDIRRGFFLSSMAIAGKNPVFGVGELNWKAENTKNRQWLGEVYYEHKNPHNAIAEIVSWFGIPALALFAFCLHAAFSDLHAQGAGRRRWLTFVLSSFLVFLGTANVMDAIFTTTYFYFYASLIFGIGAWRGGTTREGAYV